MDPHWASRTEVGGKRGVRQIPLAGPLVSLAVSFALCACAPTAPGSRVQGKAGEISPSWSASAYQSQDRDDAWHFAYAVQSWAAEQNGHVIMIPARHTIVADRMFFADEFSHIPLRFLRGVRRPHVLENDDLVRVVRANA